MPNIDIDRHKNLLVLAIGIFLFAHFSGFLFQQLGYLLVLTVFFFITYSQLKELHEKMEPDSKWLKLVQRLGMVADQGVNGTVLASLIFAVFAALNVVNAC